ncbi:MAG: phospho-N-acetylmuramoyl-pentapeptide-transferase [Candidatus Bipolaricaulota bacterium]
MSQPWVAVLGLALVLLPAVAVATRWFACRVRAGQFVRAEGPESHTQKAGTPTMAGVVPLGLFGLAVGIAGLAGVPLTARMGFVMAACGAGAALGLADDVLSQRLRRSQGIPAGPMLGLQVVAAAALYGLSFTLPEVSLAVPFFPDGIDAAALPAWAGFMLVGFGYLGAVNAVNMTDGLDGLAAGCVALVLVGALPVVLWAPDLGAMVILGAASCAGFLWVNAHPAGAFLGNVGSMGLGGLMFGVYYAGGAVLLLPLMGGFLALEVLSVILQVGSYKVTGKRLLRMSPFHHHLERGPVHWPHWLPGVEWEEPKVVVRLWIVCGLFVAFGILAWIVP